MDAIHTKWPDARVLLARPFSTGAEFGAASSSLRCLAILADAYTTRACLLRGRTEGNRFRAALIRKLGLNGGTYGVAVAWSVVVVAVNVYSAQPVWSLIVGNLITAALFGWAAWRNSRITEGTD